MYPVAVLAEQPLSAIDAEQVAGLHVGLDEPVRYHVLIPGDENAAAAAAGVLRELGRSRSAEAVAESAGSSDPVDALTEIARRTGAAEVIVLTGSHPVREALHRDWTSQVRSRLHLPTLHLLEHESFNEQSAGLGEGNSGL
jgi:hypothetical protein